MSHHRMLGAALLCASLLAPLPTTSSAHAQQAPACEVAHPVVFAGLDYDSNAFHTEVARFILEHGYGCATDSLPGALVPLHNGMRRGEVHVVMEVWKSNTPESWREGLAEGSVVEVGTNFPDATEGWYVPRYLIEGADAPAAGLRAVADLARFKEVFRDPEEPDKGRFLNCVAGWHCETVNSKKLHAYGLAEHFTNFRPGTGAALNAAVESAFKRRRPVLFYHWGPTWLLGKLGDQAVKLEEPPFDAEVWTALLALDDPAQAKAATDFPVVEVVIGANAAFVARAPALAAFLEAYATTSAQVSDALAWMQANDARADAAARHFLQSQPGVWTRWVPADVAARVKAAL